MLKVNYLYEINLIIKKFGKSKRSRLTLTTNSRNTDGCNFFIALNGERFKGSSFIKGILEKKIDVIVFNDEDLENVRPFIEKYPDILFITCDNTVVFLQELSKKLISKWKKNGGTVLALTGSNGKTTTKEYLFQFLGFVLDKKYIHVTSGNLNNHLGVPITILNLKDTHKFVILELGSNHPGEIKFLANIAQPDHALISSIGKSHLEFFDSVENVNKEKVSLFDYCKNSNPKSIITMYSKYNLINSNFDDIELIDYTPLNLKNINIQEAYNKENLFLSYKFLSRVLKTSSQKKRLKKYYPKIRNTNSMRSHWLIKNNCNYYVDAYNANPSSMEHSLNFFIEHIKKNSINLDKVLFILGDMNEIGTQKEQYYLTVCKQLNDSQIKKAVFVGKDFELYKKHFSGTSKCFLTVDELIVENTLLAEFNYIFLKASRSVQLENIIKE